MRKFGLAAILTFVDKGATAAMGRVGAKAAMLKRRFQGIGRGVGMMSAGFGQAAAAALPLVGALGFAIRDGAKFEMAFAKVRALTVNESEDIRSKLVPALEQLAQTLGATTKFSAAQASNAMEELVRAGIPVTEVGNAVAGTLKAAAAEGMGLAEAAKIVAGNVKLFRLTAKDAGTVAGQLALISTRSAASISTMQEALKLAGPPAARLANATLPETVSALGALFDIGVKNTQAGTTLRGTIMRLSKPTKEVASVFGGKAGLARFLKETNFFGGNLSGTFKAIADKLRAIPDKGKRAAAAVKIFGARAFGAAAAFDMTNAQMKRFTDTQKMLRAETGKTATKMAKELEKTLIGQLTLASSALSALNIQIFKLVAPTTKTGIKGITKTLSDLSLAIRVVRGEKFTKKEDIEAAKKLSKTYLEVAHGIKEGFSAAIETLKGLGKTVVDVARWFGVNLGGGGARGTAKVVTKVVLLAAALAPVALAVGTVTRLFGGLAKVALGAAKVVGNTLALAAKGAGGIIGAVGKRFPKVGGLLGKFGGLLGKAGKLTEQVTAQPVRVVNFHEMGGLGTAGTLLGGSSGARELDLASRGAAGTLSRFRTGLAGAVGRLGRFGSFLNSGALSLSGHTSTLGKATGALGKAGLVGAALAAGWAVGKWVDKMTGASDKISGWLHKQHVAHRKRILGPARRLETSLKQTVTSARMLNQMLAAQRKFGGIQFKRGGPRVAVTQEIARKRLVDALRRTDLNQKQVADQLKRLAPILAKFPAAAGKPTVKPPVRPAKDALISRGGFMPVSAGDVVLDRASLASAVVSQMRGGLAGRAGAGMLGGGDPGRASPAPATAGGELRIEVPVQIDGRQIALAVARVRLDDLERSGAKIEPGSRAALLQRGFEEVT